jgi:hypothetical protein
MQPPDRNIAPIEPAVTLIAVLPAGALDVLLAPYGLCLRTVADDAPIPGSYWGETEAGLVGNALYLRADTPVHSALHEACHFICMDDTRRGALHTDAKGDDLEEVGVCYLQALLAEKLPGYSQAQLFSDMDAWRYSFRLGNAQAWFEQDSEDAKSWLELRGLI